MSVATNDSNRGKENDADVNEKGEGCKEKAGKDNQIVEAAEELKNKANDLFRGH